MKTTNKPATKKMQTRSAHVAEYYYRALVSSTMDRIEAAKAAIVPCVLGDVLDDVTDKLFSDEDFVSAIVADDTCRLDLVKGFAREMAYANLKRRGVSGWEPSWG